MAQIRVEFSWSWYCICGEAGDPVDGKDAAHTEIAFLRHANETDTGAHYAGAVVAVEVIEFELGAVFMAFDRRPIDLGSLEDEEPVRFIDLQWAWLDA